MATVVTSGTGSGFGYAILAGAAGGFAGSATGALLNGANFGQIMKAGVIGAFWGGVGAGVSFGVGEIKFDDIIGKMLGHGISQGAVTAAQGGKFQHGFFSAAFTAGLAPGIMKTARSDFGKVLASSVVGGTASVLGGGKFANGAITGAYVMLFNHMMHPDDKLKGTGKIIQKRAGGAFGQRMFSRFWRGEGDYTLTKAEFENIVKVAENTAEVVAGSQEKGWIRYKFIDDEYALVFGEADVFYGKGVAIGFSDEYDFNPRKWGERGYVAEIKTRMVNSAASRQNSVIYYVNGVPQSYNKPPTAKPFIISYP